MASSTNEEVLRRIQEAKVSNAMELDLTRMGLSSLPEQILELSNLTKLYLRANKLNSLPERIDRLSNLTHLNLNGNQLKVLPKQIVELSNLRKLDIENNRLRHLPEQIGKLNNLTRLSLRRNHLSILPEQIVRLSNLEELVLSENKLNRLPNHFGQLSNLRTLYLSDNKLTNLPEQIGLLSNLNTLYLNRNLLNSLPEKIGLLDELEDLHVNGNRLNNLPEQIGHLAKLRILDLKGNQFEVGEEVWKLSVKERIQEILKWQKAKVAQKLIPIHEAKVIFIGESNYGKTHLIEMLRKGEIGRKITTTHGIERSQLPIPYKGEAIRLNIWDLGGQEFMRNTHQFFFSERTLYVLVTLARRERREMNYWLKLANQLGNNAPVLVVINKIDLDDHDIDRKSLQRDYPNIAGFVRTCVKNDGCFKDKNTIQALFENISDIVTNKEIMPSVFEKRRREWFTVKEGLEKLKEDFISYERYEQLDHIKDLPADERKRNLKLLSILGTVVSYVDDPRLMDTHVINPQWIMDGVYAIINDPKIKEENKGKFHIRELRRVLLRERFPERKHYFLVELMNKFNLCYEAKGERNTFYIPDLFDDIEPNMKDWNSDMALRFRYNYDDFSPDSFMTQFIVEKHKDIIGEYRWRSGVFISNSSCKAKVYQAYSKNYIHVEVLGKPVDRRRYLYSIQEIFRELHRPFPSIAIEEEVPYKDFWLSYEDLKSFEESQERFFHPKLKEIIPVKQILNGYSNPDRKGALSKAVKDQVMNLISTRELKGAIEVLGRFFTDDENLNVLTLIEANFLELENNVMKGKITNENYKVEKNKIMDRLMRLCD